MAAVSSLTRTAEQVQWRLVSGIPWDYSENQDRNRSGDKQTEQDIFTHQKFRASLLECAEVGNLVSEEADGLEPTGSGTLSVTLDPFDGSKAYEFGIPPGTIFGIFEKGREPSDFRGDRILAAGVFIYRHNLELILSLDGRAFQISSAGAQELMEIPSRRSLVCSNLSNISKWEEGWQSYFASRVLERTAKDKHNMRWYGSLAAHFGAIVRSGGIFAYPPDSRDGYDQGHLRLLYEAIPISFIIDSLGGRASDGERAILSVLPEKFHQKTPFVFGEAPMVRELEESIRAGRQR